LRRALPEPPSARGGQNIRLHRLKRRTPDRGRGTVFFLCRGPIHSRSARAMFRTCWCAPVAVAVSVCHPRRLALPSRAPRAAALPFPGQNTGRPTRGARRPYGVSTTPLNRNPVSPFVAAQHFREPPGSGRQSPTALPGQLLRRFSPDFYSGPTPSLQHFKHPADRAGHRPPRRPLQTFPR